MGEQAAYEEDRRASTAAAAEPPVHEDEEPDESVVEVAPDSWVVKLSVASLVTLFFVEGIDWPPYQEILSLPIFFVSVVVVALLSITGTVVVMRWAARRGEIPK